MPRDASRSRSPSTAGAAPRVRCALLPLCTHPTWSLGSHRLKHVDQTGVHRTLSEVIAIIIIIIIIIFNIMYSHLSRAFFAWVLRTGGFSGELKKLRESQSGFPFPMKGEGVIKLMLSPWRRGLRKDAMHRHVGRGGEPKGTLFRSLDRSASDPFRT